MFEKLENYDVMLVETLEDIKNVKVMIYDNNVDFNVIDEIGLENGVLRVSLVENNVGDKVLIGYVYVNGSENYEIGEFDYMGFFEESEFGEVSLFREYMIDDE